MKHAKRWIVLLSILSGFLFLTLLFIFYRDGYFHSLYQTVNKEDYHYQDNAQYTQRETLFEASPVTRADTVFVGDSITARGEWQEFFPDEIVLNRGIDSDVTEGVYNRLDTIIEKHPSRIFLMIGINDIRQNIDRDVTLSFYEKILDRLQNELPDCCVYVQSVLPVNHSTGIDNKEVQSLNASIKALADERSMPYIDLYSLLADSDNDLPKEYSIDGVHMTGAGYEIWIGELNDIVATSS